MHTVKPLTFCGLTTPCSEADIVVFGAPFDGTTCFRPGTRSASERMRADSWGFETYSPYLDCDLTSYRVADAGDLDLPTGDARQTIEQVESFVGEQLDHGRLPLMIGGEHSLTLGAVRAVAKRHAALRVVHFDAHTDLRPSMCGQPLSHASVILRVSELVGGQRVSSFGIRSGLRDEFVFARRELDFHPFTLDDLPQVLAGFGDDPVYLTIDLDVLDPSVFPGTGTPEPGGVSYMALQDAVHRFCDLNVVAADIMELAPSLDPSGASTAVACKLLRELLLTLAQGQTKRRA